MSASLSSPARPDAAVLLVLLPQTPGGSAVPGPLTNVSIRTLQGRLGPAIRVLKIEESSHPTVVQSFGGPALPACVLVRRGVELWRQQGLPDDEASLRGLLEAAQAR